jgi:hypothetical protein
MTRTDTPPFIGGPASRHQPAGPGRPGHPNSHREILANGHHRVIDLPGHGAHGTLPPQLAQLGTHLTRAYTPGTLSWLVLAGLAIAIMGALGPAIWVAATKTTTALHADESPPVTREEQDHVMDALIRLGDVTKWYATGGPPWTTSA